MNRSLAWLVSRARDVCKSAALICAAVLLSAHTGWAAGVVGTGTAVSCTDAAFNVALAGGGLVTFNCGGPATITITSTKDITADTTIDGASVITISGGALPFYVNQQPFYVNPGVNFALQNLSIVNGFSQDLSFSGIGGNGGGIENNRGRVSVTNSTFSDNGADSRGGAIYNYFGTVIVTNSTFSGNSTFYSGGGGPYGGGGIYSYNGTLTVTNSTFSGNSGEGGGAILNNAGLMMTVTNSTFSGNTAYVGGGTSGGAIYSLGPLAVTNTTFSDNSVGYEGGGIASGGALTVIDSTFSGNSAFYSGGGIVNDGGPVMVTNSTFSGNSVAYYGGGISASGGPLTVTNSTFSGNSAYRGGGIASDAFAVIVTNTVVANSPSGGNCATFFGSITDGGHNIDDGTTCGFTGPSCSTTAGTSFCNTNPVLDPTGLQNNGGPTQTIALQSGSPAIDAGDDGTCEGAPVWSVDQRGYVRPGTGSVSCSIGAYEFDSAGLGLATPTNTPTPTPTSTPTSTPTLTPAVACVAVPRTGCQPPQRAAAINLNAAAKTMGWKWLGSSTPVALSDFGDPVNGPTAYHVCVYDTSAGPPFLAFGATASAGGTCGTQPCWKQTRNRFSYTNTAATPDGVRRMTLQAGSTGADIAVSGRGSNLHMPVSADGVLLLREYPEVIVQLQRNDSPTCWEAVFTSPALRNTRWRFADTIH